MPGYVFIRMAYQLLMTVASFEMAKTLPADSYGLVFGLNTWVGVGLQTVLTVVVADGAVLALDIRPQFVVYASLYFVAGAAFAGYFLLRRFLR